MKPTVYTRSEYFADIVERMGRLKAGDRVALATMSFVPTSAGVGRIMDAMAAAARRGAEVTFFVDAYPFLLSGGRHLGPLFFHNQLPASMPEPFAERLVALKRFEKAGGRCVMLNRPGRRMTVPVAGRSHIKFALINDRVYIGGCNLDSDTQADLMVGWDDEKVAKWLRAWASRFSETGNVRIATEGADQSLEVGDGVSLLMDSGVPNQSAIFEQAMTLIDEARERVFMTCQYFPNDVTVQHLMAAHKRGVKVTILYNDPKLRPWPQNWAHIGVERRERMRAPTSFFAHALSNPDVYLHAKLLATEKGAIIGSHNYVTAGVRLGTAEIALVSNDPGLGLRAIAAVERQVDVGAGPTVAVKQGEQV